MSKQLSPQQRVNRLVKDLKSTPYQIGLVYLEELLITAVKTDSLNIDIREMFLSDAHYIEFREKVNTHLTNNRV